MKRKYQPSLEGEDDVVLTLGDGIPPLQRTISETGPSIPKMDEHPPASFEVAPFGLIPEGAWERMRRKPSRLFTNDDGVLIYSSENDVAAFVKSFVSAIVKAIGLSGAVQLHSGIGTFDVRPDLWVVLVTGIPVGVIEVKKPDVLGKPSGMSHPNVLGELYDFLKHLPNFYGVSPCFGILTNMDSWRFAWLPDDNADAMAGEEERLDEPDETTAEEEKDGDDAQEHTLLPHCLLEDEEDPNENTCDELESDARSLHVSQVFDKSDTPTLVRAITSAILKMLRADSQPFSTPFDRLSERTILKFTKGADRAVFWTRLNVTPKWDRIAKPIKYLFAIEDLGHGADGRVWLMSSSKGAVCVLKFSRDKKISSVTAEEKAWKRAYPEMKVHVEFWCGHPALRMPYFCPELKEKDLALALAKDCLLKRFAEKKMIHQDVEWRNIGFFKSGDDYLAVVFDLASVRDMEQEENATWVDTACTKLASSWGNARGHFL